MMNKTYTCIICPTGCEIQVEYEGTIIKSMEGNLCDRGKDYVTKEITAPERNIASSVRVKNGVLPLVSIKTSKTIPKEKIMDVMKEINKASVEAPVKIGQVILENVVGTGSDIVATKNVEII